ncbi:hypothetical protein GCM10023080_077700 [Streptomyces pseudoechinosporeus]
MFFTESVTAVTASSALVTFLTVMPYVSPARLLDHDGRCVGVVPLRNPHGPEPSASGPDLSVG